MILELVKEDAPILKQACEDFDFSNPPCDPVELAKNLNETMIAKDGLGLSANQVGIDNRVFSIVFNNFAETFFDPKIVEYSEETTLFEEGCLSQPGVFINLKRPQKIKIEYTTRTGERITADFGGITARIIQHEYDHMEGTNFLKLASPLKRALALKKAKQKKR